MTEIRVPVKAWLRGTTYRALTEVAKQQGAADVGALLEAMAERALIPKPSSERNTRRWKRVTPDMVDRMRELHAAGWFQRHIARELGVSDASVSRFLNPKANS
jgi:hypothetical protein